MTTAIMLRTYARSMMNDADFKRHPRLARALYQWCKRWWAGLSRPQRGGVSRALKAGRLPTPKAFIGAPFMAGQLRPGSQGMVDRPASRAHQKLKPFHQRKLRRIKARKKAKAGK